jgi:hypothetical protein
LGGVQRYIDKRGSISIRDSLKILTKGQLRKPVIILPALVVVYFLAFPTDLEVLAEVLISAAATLAKVLALSDAVAPWLYALLSVVILSKTVTRVLGLKTQSTVMPASWIRVDMA